MSIYIRSGVHQITQYQLKHYLRVHVQYAISHCGDAAVLKPNLIANDTASCLINILKERKLLNVMDLCDSAFEEIISHCLERMLCLINLAYSLYVVNQILGLLKVTLGFDLQHVLTSQKDVFNYEYLILIELLCSDYRLKQVN